MANKKDGFKKSTTPTPTSTAPVTARVTKLSDTENPVALASITILDSFVIDSIKVMYSPKNQRHFLSFPARKTKDDEWKEVAHPISKEMLDQCAQAVKSALEEKYPNEDWLF